MLIGFVVDVHLLFVTLGRMEVRKVMNKWPRKAPLVKKSLKDTKGLQQVRERISCEKL